MSAIRSIGVFLSAGDVADEYRQAGAEMGRLIAEGGYTLVWGGSDTGLMKVVSDAAQAAGGRIVAVTMKRLEAVLKPSADEKVVTLDLAHRKVLLLARSDALVLLPGGLGSIDEFTEILERKKHDEHAKPMVVLNVAGFYDGFKMQLERMHDEGFLPRRLDSLVGFASTPAEALRLVVTAADP
jgi:uncharacterized protein (TIGR00730 family)